MECVNNDISEIVMGGRVFDMWVMMIQIIRGIFYGNRFIVSGDCHELLEYK